MLPSLLHRCVGLLAVLFLFAALVDSGSFAQAPRDKQIDEIQKQIDELTKKLNELKKAGGQPTPADGALNPDWLKAMTWRCIGPATMGGRITAVSVFDADPTTYYVATASGGLLKTVNNGVTFDHQFDKETTVSIGDVCVAPSDRNIVWVGTGENNPRNSVSYGDGVYKSTDGGKTWKNMGLKKSYQIGKIIIHPKDPNTVYIGALGRLYGNNEERGLFKTTDGGKTWEKILYIDDKTGVIDIRMSPADPNTLIIATWDRWRDGFDSWPGDEKIPDGYDGYDPLRKWGAGTGIWKTADGGKTFKKLTEGLPTCLMGRIGLDYYLKDPNTVFAIIDTEQHGKAPPGFVADAYIGVAGEDAETGVRLTQVSPKGPAEKAGLKTGDIVLGIDAKTVVTYKQFGETLKAFKPNDKITVKIVRNKEAMEIPVTLAIRPGAGNRPFAERLAGQIPNVQDKQGKDGFEYGGVYKSTDGGETWKRINSINPRPMYFSQVRVDPLDDKYLYVLGIGLHMSSDGGKTFGGDAGKSVHADHHAMWINPKDGRHMIVGCDGGLYVSYDRTAHWDFLNHMALGQFYHVCFDMRKPYYVYGGLQDNGSWGGPSRVLRGTGPTNDDWIVLGGGDGFVCRADPSDPDIVYGESQGGFIYRRNLKTGEFKPVRPKTAAKGGTNHRFNWNAPFILSSHNPSILYLGGEYVWRSVNRGDDLRIISPEITRTKRGSATAIAESPRSPDTIWAGTDDGNLWVTRDGGKIWTNVIDKLALPGPRWVSTIEASRFADGRAYVAFDAHRSDDDEPYLYVTEDFGQTWKSLRNNLPTGSTRCLREDVANPNLLFCGTEFACFVSIDRGDNWQKLNNNLPTVAIHELAIHPTAGEMVAATHGRSLWVLDITPLRQMTDKALKSPAFLYEPNAAVYWRPEPAKGSPFGNGSRRFYGENPPRGAVIYYSLARKPEKLELKIVDHTGRTIRTLQAKTDAGLHKLVWDLRTTVQPPTDGKAQPKGKGPPGQALPGPPASPGTYRVVLTADGVEQAQSLRVEADPVVPAAILTPEEPKVQKATPAREEKVDY